MKQVNLYIEMNHTAFQKRERVCGYVLEYVTKSGVPVTREGFREGSGTYHQETLKTIAEALERIREPCSICIYGRDNFILAMIDSKLKEWAENGFISNGKSVTNREEWQAVWEKINIHQTSTCAGKHSYTNWMLVEMEEQCEKKSKETKEHPAKSGQ